MFKNVMKFAFLFMIGAVLITSCGKDPVIDPEPVKNPPTLTLSNAGNALPDTIHLENSINIQVVDIKAAKGTANMKVMYFYASDTLLDYANTAFKIDGAAMSSNPVSVFGTDSVSLDWKMQIDVPNAYDTPYSYTFKIEDLNGKTAEATIVYIIDKPVIVSDLEMDGTADFIFYNNKGANKGGLDVRDGSAQSTVSGTPHIKDNGGDPWKKTISAIPGTSGFAISIMATTDVDFDAILKQSEIQAIFDAGTMVPSDGESAPISEGDIFAVRVITGVDTQVTTISLVKFVGISDVTGSDNDTYTVNIKK